MIKLFAGRRLCYRKSNAVSSIDAPGARHHIYVTNSRDMLLNRDFRRNA